MRSPPGPSGMSRLESDLESLESFGDHDGWPSQIHSILVCILRMRHHGGRGWLDDFPVQKGAVPQNYRQPAARHCTLHQDGKQTR